MNPGRTYTLTDRQGDSTLYYQLIRKLTDGLIDTFSSEAVLREKIRNASTWKGVLSSTSRRGRHIRKILKEMEKALTPYLTGVEEHLHGLSLADRFDQTLRSTRWQYVLYMLEIELTNRINREGFSTAPWRMALIPHCLRDFRNSCQWKAGEIEKECAHCDKDCFASRGSELLERYHIQPYISVSIDHRRLFGQLKAEHPEMGVLGIACVPELVMGMRLCEGLGIPAVGVPLDANRCSRWMDDCLETTFSLQELERLVEGSV